MSNLREIRCVDANSIVTKGQDHVETIAGDEIVLMHVETGRFFTLAGSGRRVWEMMATPIAIGDLTRKVTQDFDVDSETCLNDIVELCERLKEGALIDVAA